MSRTIRARAASFVVMTILAACTAWTAARIEVQNAEAGYYLPRADLADGAWRASPDGTARDVLRETVATAGVLQYLLAPSLICLAAFVGTRPDVDRRKRWLAAVACLIGIAALALALQRGYLVALGD